MFNLFVYQPLYNGLVFLINIIPWADAGIVVVVFTVLVKLILFPLSKKAVVTQLKMKKIEPELKLLKEKYTNKQKQARQIMLFYKEKGVNPFSSFFLILIQLPIIFGLYKIFLNPNLTVINSTLLYSFVAAPHTINMLLFGLIDISQKSLILAIFAGVSSYFQVQFSVPALPKKESKDKPSFKDDFVRSMNIQMRYFFPLLAFFISWNISGAIALYWITSNLFTIGQEVVVRRKLENI